MKTVSIYTDGSFHQSSNSAGWSFVCVSDKVILKNGKIDFEVGPRGALIGELVALHHAIKYAQKHFKDQIVQIHTDCQSLMNILTNVKESEGYINSLGWVTAKLKGLLYFVANAAGVVFKYTKSGKSTGCLHGIAHFLAGIQTGIDLKGSERNRLSHAVRCKKMHFEDGSALEVVNLCSCKI